MLDLTPRFFLGLTPRFFSLTRAMLSYIDNVEGNGEKRGGLPSGESTLRVDFGKLKRS
jgi:hypothetical protein